MNAPRPVEPVRFLVFGTALRSESLNARAARLAEGTIEASRAKVRFGVGVFHAPKTIR